MQLTVILQLLLTRHTGEMFRLRVKTLVITLTVGTNAAWQCPLSRDGTALPRRPTSPRDLALLRLPEDLRDLLDLREQLVRRGDVGRALGAATTPGQLRGLVDEGVQLRVLLEVRRLEVVRPQHPQVVLDEFRALFLDDERPGAELRVGVRGVLLADGLDGLRLDPGLFGVVDTARQVAVCVRDGLRREQPGEQPHRFPFSVPDPLGFTSDTTPWAWS